MLVGERENYANKSQTIKKKYTSLQETERQNRFYFIDFVVPNSNGIIT